MTKPRVLIVESPYYAHIADLLAKGATAALDKAGFDWDRVQVPGALEIPGGISLAAAAGDQGGIAYDGFVALGCVIRGATSHYDIVAGESARALMDMTVYDGLIIGNGILTVENEDQALARANPDDLNKGGGAAEAVVAMMALRKRLTFDE